MNVKLEENNPVKSLDMHEGDMGIMLGGYRFEIVLRVHEGLVSLTDPGHTWLTPNSPIFDIRPLPKGTRVILEQE